MDYVKEFKKYERKDELSGYQCFYNYDELFNAIKILEDNQQTASRYVHKFFRNSKYNFEYIEISALGNEARYK